MREQFEVAMLVASIRKGSINERLARAIELTAPTTLAFKRVHFDMLPFYNGDLEANRPSCINAFAKRIQQADGVCIVTPEYNRSIPAVLKNAIDWASRPPNSNVWSDKVIAVCGASPGAIGTALGQQHLRQILACLGGIVLPGEAYISFKSPSSITADGRVSEDELKNFIASFSLRFAKLIEQMHIQELRVLYEASQVQAK